MKVDEEILLPIIQEYFKKDIFKIWKQDNSIFTQGTWFTDKSIQSKLSEVFLIVFLILFN